MSGPQLLSLYIIAIVLVLCWGAMKLFGWALFWEHTRVVSQKYFDTWSNDTEWLREWKEWKKW